MKSLFFTLVGNVYLFFGSALFGGLAMLGRPKPFWPRRMGRIWSKGLLASSGVRLLTSGSPPPGACVLMPNHTSLMDIPVLEASTDERICFVSKKQLFAIPFFGWGMRAAAFIPVDREDRSQATDVLRRAEARLRQGDTVVIFPEETRSKTGDLLPFQRGGFLIALRSRCPIVPVGIRGSRAVREKGGLRVRPGVVEVRFGEPVDPRGSGVRDKAELIARVRHRVAELAAATPVEDRVARDGADS